MDSPIINPIYFYLIDVIPVLGAFITIVGICICIYGTILLFSNINKLIVKKWFIFGIVIVVLGILFPSKDACYQMVTAKTITPNNIKAITDYVNDTATNVSDNLTDAIKDIMDYSVDRIYNVRNNEKVGD
jgi:membrane-bound ClpP family serine protease